MQVTLPEAAVLPARGGEPTELAMLVDGLGEPVDPRVATNGLVLWVDHDDFEVLVNRILSNPVRIQNTQGSTIATSSLL